MDNVYRSAIILQWNARGIRSKLPDVKLFLLKYPIPILAICEAYVKDDFRISGYNIFRCVRSGLSRTILGIRQDIPAARLQGPAVTTADYVSCKVRLNNMSLTVASVYIPPSTPASHRDYRTIFDGLQTPFLVAGDINAHNQLWGSRRTDRRGELWNDIFDSMNLCLLNDGSPTFLRRDFSTDVLDVSICSRDIARSSVWTTDVDGRGSDHLPIYITFDGCSPKPRCKSVRLTNWATFRTSCTELLHDGMSAEQLSSAVSDALQSASLTVKVPSGHLGVNSRVEQLRAQRRRAERKARRSGLLEDMVSARRCAKLVREELKAIDRHRWRHFCSTLSPFRSPGRVWSVARTLKETPPQRNPLSVLALSVDRPEADVACDFCAVITAASHAASTAIFEAHTSRIREEIMRMESVTHHEMDMDFSLAELQSAIHSTRTRSSPGPDKVTYQALRNLGVGGMSVLLSVFNSSWREGAVPRSWKHALVVPLLKPGKHPSDLSSFRPVSLTSCIGKVLEKMVLNRLEWWLESRRIFPEEMAGFRRHRSPMDGVLDLVTTVQHAKSQRKIVTAVFLDVKRAYDTVSHAHVLHALMLAGAPSKLFHWLADFLRQRTVSVRCQSGTSPDVMLTHGVPQGSVLSPVLFNLVMVSLKLCLHRKVHISIYADDICIWTVGKSRPAIRNRLQGSLSRIKQHLTEIGLDLSAEKTAVLSFTRKQCFRLLLGSAPIRQVRHHRFLGVFLDANLSWKKHVDYLVTRAQRWISVIRHFAGWRWGLDERSLLGLHRSLIQGSLLYSLPVLHGLSQSSIQRLHCVLARSLRICLGVPRPAETRAVIAEARAFPIEVLRCRETFRHYLRLTAHHRRHPLITKIRRRRESPLCACFDELKPRVPQFAFKPPVPTVPPWSLPVPPVSLSIPGLKGQKDQIPTPILRQMALDMMQTSYAGHTAVFTDGSTTGTSSSAGFVIPSCSFSYGSRLAHRTSSTSAELHAILSFLQYASQMEPRSWVLYVDSKPALHCIEGMGLRGSLAPLVTDVLIQAHRLSISGHVISLQWVPGHCGLAGNEEADRIAAAAHQGRRYVLNLLTKGDRRAFLFEVAQPAARQQWRQDLSAASLMRAVDPGVSFTVPRSLPRAFTSLMHRLRLSVAFTPHFKFKIGATDSDLCSRCGVAADIVHVVTDCALYERQRDVLRGQLSQISKRPFCPATVLGPWQDPVLHRRFLVLFMAFLASTGLLQTL